MLAATEIRIIKDRCGRPGARANAIAERWIASASRECLDWILIISKRHMRLVFSNYANKDNSHRPHPSLQQIPPCWTSAFTFPG